MIVQRLCPKGTLETALGELLHGNGRELLESCKLVRGEKISAATGAYSQARQRIPAEAARRITERTFEQLHRIRQGDTLRDRLFLLDGSSIRLALRQSSKSIRRLKTSMAIRIGLSCDWR